jgi:hypothetical protein
MNMWRQKHRMKSWLRRSLAVLFLMTSWGALAAAMETVKAISKYSWIGTSDSYIYSTSLEAAQAYGVWYNTNISYNMVTDISCPSNVIPDHSGMMYFFAGVIFMVCVLHLRTLILESYLV